MYCLVNCFKDEPTVCRRNIPGSWGFNWNWYLFYPNSEIPRSKGICYSSCRSKSQVYLQGALQCKQLTMHWLDNSLDQMCHNALLEFQSLQN
uniref:Uncharacterized protein n=1 Tax=Vitis vinifera TaxID=29760 RepID=F6I3D6_VITVI